MRSAIPVAAVLWAIGCNTAGDGPTTENADAARDGQDSSPAGAQCVSGTLPAGAPSLSIDIRTSLDSTGRLPSRRAAEGHVSVERAVSGELDLVADSGERIALRDWSGQVPMERLAVGARLWLSAFQSEDRPNPYAYVSSSYFTLRTEQDGPVLLAALAGRTMDGADLLGVPMSVRSLCSVDSPTGGTALDTRRSCSATVERFEIAVEADPPVRIKPGTMVSATLGGRLYDLALASAESTTYSESGCEPADWAFSLRLGFFAVARDWSDMVAKLPVFTAAQLPTCRLGVDAPPVVVDVEKLDWNVVPLQGFESTMSVTQTDGQVVTFALPSLGTVTARAGSAQGAAVLARGRWLSMVDFQYVIREREAGPAIASVFKGDFSRLVSFASAPDVLGIELGIKPRCDWIAAGCSEGGKVLASSLHDVLFGDGLNQRVPSHQRAAMTAGGRSFEAWVAVTPGCHPDPSVNAAFLATE